MARRVYDPVVQAYIDHLNTLFNTTISEGRLSLIKLGPSGPMAISRFQGGRRLPFALRPPGYLHFRQLVSRIAEHVQITEGLYIFSTSRDPDDEESWLFRYEYDRIPEPGKLQSHLHVNAEHRGQSLRKIHFPTARVSVEQLIAHLITEHHATSARSDWMPFLSESHAGFGARRTDLQADAFP